MKKLFTLLFLLNILVAYAQVFDVETILNSGDDDKRINIVILADGYQQAELAQFIADATNITNELFSQSPYAEYKSYFNVYAIKVPSNESGADHPGTATDVSEPVFPVIDVDNYFGSTFDFASIHRLLVPVNNSAITNVLAANFPLYDQVLILVNSPYYGGSGGQYATTSLEASAAEIAIHELGHSFANLADEYWAGNSFATERINMTQETNPALVRWTNWVGDHGVGIYQHCCGGNSASWYRPHDNCKMRYLGVPFCSVCSEGTIERIHTLVSSIDSFTPVTTVFATNSFPVDFALNLIDPIPNTLDRNWMVNGSSFASGISSISLQMTDFVVGANTVVALVEDTTSLLRVDNHNTIHLNSVTWNVEYDPTLGITDITSETNKLKIDVFPNPGNEIINIKFTTEAIKDFRAELYSLDGKLIKAVPSNSSDLLSVDIADLSKGIYLLKIYNENTYINTSKIVKE